ncbi:hypothetical protein BIV57_04905 [Mangrovactinospora gilvigrisea]|uniref:Lipid/polyisoprenoid-binding YceI-like domain-containing protein n=1 Tax=Mangrovactinospora gilvigrisea TaxID=1428644 RepID=A0A1J7BJ73_9ACTN|nr:hypothetical protein BIV57_04905 [Mangrovactinospora gilvigrisea]
MLSMQVVDQVGMPLPEVEVTATDSANGRVLQLGATDPYGTLAASVAPGEYRLALQAESFQTLRLGAQIAAGSVTPLGRLSMELAPPPELPSRGYWEIDPAHTAIRFIAQHIGMANVHGRFENFAGSLFIAERVEDSSVEITIDAASINTGVKMRDDHLRSADFLEVERYPYLHFVSDRMQHRGGARWQIGGTLTLHGVSRSVQLDTNYLGNGSGMEGETRVACFASAELHREDFTLNWRKMLAKGIAVVGATIRIELDVQAVYQGEQPPAHWS